MESVILININELKPHPLNSTIYAVDEGEQWKAFVASISENGIQHPLVVNTDNVIISGHRRWLASKLLNKETVPCIVRTFASDNDEARILIESNRHRTKTFSEIMREAEELKRLIVSGAKERQLAGVAVDDGRTAHQRETTSVVGASLGYSGRTFRKMEELWELGKSNPTIMSKIAGLDAGTMSVDGLYKLHTSSTKEKDREVYDVWRFPQPDMRYGQPHPGRIPGQLIKNVIYLTTEPGDLVVDPFGGGGTTLDVCKDMGRRCNIYDIDPRRNDILHNDIASGYPTECEGAQLVFLDPPYARMLAEDYSADGCATLSMLDYLTFISFLAGATFRVLAIGGSAALIIMKQRRWMSSHTGGRLPVGVDYVDWPFECDRIFREAGFIPQERITFVYGSSYGNLVQRALDEGRLVTSGADLMIWKKPTEDERFLYDNAWGRLPTT